MQQCEKHGSIAPVQDGTKRCAMVRDAWSCCSSAEVSKRSTYQRQRELQHRESLQPDRDVRVGWISYFLLSNWVAVQQLAVVVLWAAQCSVGRRGCSAEAVLGIWTSSSTDVEGVVVEMLFGACVVICVQRCSLRRCRGCVLWGLWSLAKRIFSV